MTDPDRADIELLAALDAGLLNPAQHRAVRDNADPAALAGLAALARTRAQLAALPALTAPPEVTARWTAELPAAPAPIDAPAPKRPTRFLRHLAMSAAAAVLAVVTGIWATQPDVVGFDRVDLVAVGTSTVGVHDLGELADTDRRASCLRTLHAPDAPVLGGRRVRMDGRPGTLLVLGTGELGRFRLVVVDPSCAVVLAQATVGGR